MTEQKGLVDYPCMVYALSNETGSFFKGRIVAFAITH